MRVHEMDLIEVLLCEPVYIGDPQAGKMLFVRQYGENISLSFYVDVYGDTVSVAISFRDCVLAEFEGDTGKVEIHSDLIWLYRGEKVVATIQTVPLPSLVIKENM